MKRFFSTLRERFSGPSYADYEDDEGYVELENESGDARAKVLVRPFVLEEYEDIKDILNILREGRTIALINILPLKEKDIVELKRAVGKLKKTAEAISGSVAGFGDDYIVATPAFAKIARMPKRQREE
jgi:SepF-like predicted cell division protein (DUF552 family)